MLRSKVLCLAVAFALFSTASLYAQTATDSSNQKAVAEQQIELRKAKYLAGLQKVSSEKELRYADSLTEAKGFSEADIICFAQDFRKVHRYEFKNLIEFSNYKLTADSYVDSNNIVRAKVARPSTKEEEEKGLSELRKQLSESPKIVESDKIAEAQVGKPAPLFTVADVDGVKYDLKELRGKVVVLNFWFIGCGPCRREMPELNKLVEKYKSKDVVFLAFEVNDNPPAKVKMITMNSFNYTQIPSKRNDVESKYKVQTYPTSYVIDQSGIIRFGMTAYNPFKLPELDKTIEKLLSH
jgi:thiol-disulfide isomerase/thioredoxin